MNAFRSNIPDKTFEKLNNNGDFTRLAVSPGIINKHYTPAQFQTMAKVIGETGAIKYSASYSILLSISTVEVEKKIEELEDAGLYVAKQGPIVAMKACDFCDGDKMEAAPITEKLYHSLEGITVPTRLRVNVNGCASACYNAVYDDIGLVYQKDSFDVYLGAVPMGANATAGTLFAKKVGVELIEGFLKQIIELYKEHARPNEPFYKFHRRTNSADYWKDLS
ncbi:precorrin-3B methylase [Lysinibacillus sp. KCTC 33748]|uniref:precorrin-3B methylase n=1 Tax=unclassified Lysinibacillus TaxID=2636778 RepID=UPI0009A5DE42|nr:MULTISPECIES: precorrin-3B methylase [unclassified Lysinibacillus]OXS74985.1 precorrin-3B methylase [Lysinibacillus sp. KCTC 33748]SKB61271.1 Nitrite and sulphite reductase 4Fe-4S domain-containing protein [Lysinibacillus sp. AC-3]